MTPRSRAASSPGVGSATAGPVSGPGTTVPGATGYGISGRASAERELTAGDGDPRAHRGHDDEDRARVDDRAAATEHLDRGPKSRAVAAPG